MMHPNSRPIVFCERCGTPIRKRKDRPSRFCSRVCLYSPRPLLPHPSRSDLLLIPLRRGRHAVIDAVDADLVADSFWKLNPKQWNTDYVYRDSDSGMEFLHHVILGVVDETPIDHKDGDGMNNSRSNLRLTTPSLNQANRGLNRNNTSGFKGVRRINNRWNARIRVNRVLIELGRFDDILDAARAYDAAAVKHFGDHARLNLP